MIFIKFAATFFTDCILRTALVNFIKTVWCIDKVGIESFIKMVLFQNFKVTIGLLMLLYKLFTYR